MRHVDGMCVYGVGQIGIKDEADAPNLSPRSLLQPEFNYLARRCHWKALDALVLSAVGRGVIQRRSAWTLRPVMCAVRHIHKNLHFKNAITRLLRQLVMAPEA